MANKNGKDNDGGNAAGKPRKVGEAFDAEFKGFINLELSKAQRDQFVLWTEEVDLAERMGVHCTDGIVLSVKVDPKSGGFMASGTQRRVLSANAGLAVTARAKDPFTALWRLMFLLEILGGGSWEDVQPVANPDRW